MEAPNKAKYYEREELNVEPIREIAQEVLSEVSRVIVGYGEILQQLFIALLVNGHVLLEGVPGLGKTVMAKTFAKTLGISFRRVQFTPDLLPSDITGTKIFDQNEGAFVLQKGPFFANIVLADEINRSAPKTQAALLEAMAERQITIEGETLPLEKPFMVVATENPVEMEGTYPLPEAQIDRFLFKLWLDYPEQEDEVEILKRQIIYKNRFKSGKMPTSKKYLSNKMTTMQTISISPALKEWVQRYIRINNKESPEDERYKSISAFYRYILENAIKILESGKTLDDLKDYDDKEFNDMLKTYLREKLPSIRILQAFNGFEAGRDIAEVKPSIVILDIDLPGLDGTQLCAQIKNDTSFGKPAVISVTGLDDSHVKKFLALQTKINIYLQ